MDIALIPNPDKPDAMAAAVQIEQLLAQRSASIAGGLRVKQLICPNHDALAAYSPDLAVVLGGDGTILAIAQALGDLDVKVVGVNFGKLGYMAAFSLAQFEQHLDLILAGEAPFTERLMLEAAIYPWDRSCSIQSLKALETQTPRATGVALNDVVINAGDPFRMIELEVQIDEQRTTTFRSDGVIVATPSGSTGYNLSASGPLISPEVKAMVLTPICPHSLSFRPVVLPATSAVLIVPHRLNAGSKVNFDGQVILPLVEDECVLVRRAASTMTLIENPDISHWQMLAHKMHWAQSPRH